MALRVTLSGSQGSSSRVCGRERQNNLRVHGSWFNVHSPVHGSGYWVHRSESGVRGSKCGDPPQGRSKPGYVAERPKPARDRMRATATVKLRRSAVALRTDVEARHLLRDVPFSRSAWQIVCINVSSGTRSHLPPVNPSSLPERSARASTC